MQSTFELNNVKSLKIINIFTYCNIDLSIKKGALERFLFVTRQSLPVYY